MPHTLLGYLNPTSASVCAVCMFSPWECPPTAQRCAVMSPSVSLFIGMFHVSPSVSVSPCVIVYQCVSLCVSSCAPLCLCVPVCNRSVFYSLLVSLPRKNWSPSWVVLVGNSLVFFKDPKSQTPSSWVCRHNLFIIITTHRCSDPELLTGRQYIIILIHIIPAYTHRY